MNFIIAYLIQHSRVVTNCLDRIWLRIVPLGMLVRILLVHVVFATALPASASPVRSLAPNAFDRLTSLTALKWRPLEMQRISGRTMYVRRLQSPLALAQVARNLSHSGVFTEMLLAPSMIQMSGIDDKAWHWLAQLEPAAQGVTGYVSVLDLSASAQDFRSSGLFHVLRGVGSEWQLLFSQEHSSNHSDLQQQIARVALPHADCLSYLRRTLHEKGWMVDETQLATSTFTAWHRSHERLVLLPASDDKSSMLYYSREAAPGGTE